MGGLQLQQRVLGLPAYRNPATAGLQLLHQHQQFGLGIRLKNRAGHIDHVRFEDFHQSEIVQQKVGLALQPQTLPHFVRNTNIGGQ